LLSVLRQRPETSSQLALQPPGDITQIIAGIVAFVCLLRSLKRYVFEPFFRERSVIEEGIAYGGSASPLAGLLLDAIVFGLTVAAVYFALYSGCYTCTRCKSTVHR
jgi:hypothetical protein